MKSTAKTIVFWGVMVASALLLWRVLRDAPGYQLEHSLGGLALGLLIFWAIRVTMSVVRHEQRIAKIERESNSNTAPR